MPTDVHKSLARAATLPEAIAILVADAGSDDKLARKLGTSRQTVIRWRKHGVFPEDYVEPLRALGVPDRLLSRFDREAIESRLRKAESLLDEIRRMLR